MKIDDALQKAVALNNDKTENKPAPRASEAKTPVAGESVTLSPLASQLQSIEAAGANEQVYDAEKVSAIKSAISSGQFRVDSEKVADGLINTVRDLLTAPR
ncbi:flagellar biosynthesis anti-sigma factor FlgM [Methylobacillus arboreus]|uniref:flagellar biosynthesis anti-sigma factor FlgM n=1 Tax=Methylobacillus arboreus TaxID=755170 RepID=UPI001E30AE4D|nr:flagellar biosynthesis anti-sigma factor FlgM [Methylobacillus arboreus]MCB5189288.1 flagellar biosynthesis anti-sigma factor FlgM [Methylobacillus arboreus]